MEIDIVIDSLTNCLVDNTTGIYMDEFGTKMRDGRLTEPSDGKIYKLREAILASKKLGRPLTAEEMSQYER